MSARIEIKYNDDNRGDELVIYDPSNYEDMITLYDNQTEYDVMLTDIDSLIIALHKVRQHALEHLGK